MPPPRPGRGRFFPGFSVCVFFIHAPCGAGMSLPDVSSFSGVLLSSSGGGSSGGAVVMCTWRCVSGDSVMRVGGLRAGAPNCRLECLFNPFPPGRYPCPGGGCIWDPVLRTCETEFRSPTVPVRPTPLWGAGRTSRRAPCSRRAPHIVRRCRGRMGIPACSLGCGKLHGRGVSAPIRPTKRSSLDTHDDLASPRPSLGPWGSSERLVRCRRREGVLPG